MQAPLKNSPGATGAQVNPLTDPRCANFLRHFFPIAWARVLDAPRVGLARERGREYPRDRDAYLAWHEEIWSRLPMERRVDLLLERLGEIRRNPPPKRRPS